jgi:hypothetical protein
VAETRRVDLAAPTMELNGTKNKFVPPLPTTTKICWNRFRNRGRN